MAIPNKQIGWSNESNLIWEISRQLEQLIGVAYTAGNKPYKSYVALLTQSGNDAPTATILENTLGFTPSWEYVNSGEYGFNFPTTPDYNKITFFGQPFYGLYQITKNSDGKDVMLYYQEGDDNMQNLNIEVRVYN